MSVDKRVEADEIKKKIVEILRQKDMSARDLSNELGISYKRILHFLYHLEERKKVERKKWFGYWVWTARCQE